MSRFNTIFHCANLTQFCIFTGNVGDDETDRFSVSQSQYFFLKSSIIITWCVGGKIIVVLQNQEGFYDTLCACVIVMIKRTTGTDQYWCANTTYSVLQLELCHNFLAFLVLFKTNLLKLSFEFSCSRYYFERIVKHSIFCLKIVILLKKSSKFAKLNYLA